MGGQSYRWYLVAVAMVTLMLAVGAAFSAFGLYVLPVSAELKLSRAEMNTAMILVNLGVAVSAPFIGRLLDRYSPKRIMTVSSIVFGASFIVLGLSQSIWLSAFVLLVPFSISLQGASISTMAVFIARWFHANRGRAMAVAFMGGSLGAIVTAPLTGLLIQTVGWRSTLIITGVSLGAILTLFSLTMRDNPTLPKPENEVSPGGRAPATVGSPMEVGALLRMPMFWLIAAPISTAMAVLTATTVSLVPLAQSHGLTPLQATSLITATGFAGVAGKLLTAVVDAKVDRRFFITTILVLGAPLYAVFMFSDTYALLVVSAVGLGVTAGAITPSYVALIADRFGAATFGTAQGIVTLMSALLSMVAVRTAGEVFDRTGSYQLLFAGFIMVQLLAAALMLGARLVHQGQAPAETVAAT